MTSAELKKIGVALFGDKWRPSMAAEIGVSRQTVWRWYRNLSPIPETKAKKLRAMMENAKIGA
jgi:hypothetical protein